MATKIIKLTKEEFKEKLRNLIREELNKVNEDHKPLSKMSTQYLKDLYRNADEEGLAPVWADKIKRVGKELVRRGVRLGDLHKKQ